MNRDQEKAMFASQGRTGSGIRKKQLTSSKPKLRFKSNVKNDVFNMKKIGLMTKEIDPSGDFKLIGKPYEPHVEIFLKTGKIRDDKLPEYYDEYYRYWLKDIIKPGMSEAEIFNVLKSKYDQSVKKIKNRKRKWSFSVKEEGSLHESPYYDTREEAERQAEKYLNGKHGKYSFRDTLVISPVNI
ncbi:MAG: hypothetical protein KGI08_08620 [Thaumarchaeota archaeon]|nr:hypothetical protein [Nitrososphaerota archaeon]